MAVVDIMEIEEERSEPKRGWQSSESVCVGGGCLVNAYVHVSVCACSESENRGRPVMSGVVLSQGRKGEEGENEPRVDRYTAEGQMLPALQAYCFTAFCGNVAVPTFTLIRSQSHAWANDGADKLVLEAELMFKCKKESLEMRYNI
ncbi:hypothetical protein NQZ68_031417 [Dissostichus eleginoides]|nr:hypothetical protein NQZ68_031417 [Dissostichus eleginoides]